MRQCFRKSSRNLAASLLVFSSARPPKTHTARFSFVYCETSGRPKIQLTLVTFEVCSASPTCASYCSSTGIDNSWCWQFVRTIGYSLLRLETTLIESIKDDRARLGNCNAPTAKLCTAGETNETFSPLHVQRANGGPTRSRATPHCAVKAFQTMPIYTPSLRDLTHSESERSHLERTL